jgi:hypothetical protein
LQKRPNVQNYLKIGANKINFFAVAIVLVGRGIFGGILIFFQFYRIALRLQTCAIGVANPSVSNTYPGGSPAYPKAGKLNPDDSCPYPTGRQSYPFCKKQLSDRVAFLSDR